MQPEPWMEELASALRAGYYQLDTDGEGLPLPAMRHNLPAVETGADVYRMLMRMAEQFGATEAEMTALVFHLGMERFCDRRIGGQAGTAVRLDLRGRAPRAEYCRVMDGVQKRRRESKRNGMA